MSTATSIPSYNDGADDRQKPSASSFVLNFHIYFFIISLVFTAFLLRASMSACISSILRSLARISWSAQHLSPTTSRIRHQRWTAVQFWRKDYEVLSQFEANTNTNPGITQMEMTDIIPEIITKSSSDLTLEEYFRTVLKKYPQGISRLTLMEAVSPRKTSSNTISSDTHPGLGCSRLPGHTNFILTTSQENPSDSRVEEETTVAVSFERFLTPMVDYVVRIIMRNDNNGSDEDDCYVPGSWKKHLKNQGAC